MLGLAILKTTGFSVQTNFSTNQWKNELLPITSCMFSLGSFFFQSKNGCLTSKKAHNKKNSEFHHPTGLGNTLFLAILTLRTVKIAPCIVKQKGWAICRENFTCSKPHFLLLGENAAENGGTYLFFYVQTVLAHQILSHQTGKGKILCKRSIHQQLLENKHVWPYAKQAKRTMIDAHYPCIIIYNV